ncbi:hypothetical protein [Acidicapsa acidisoli]|uniref:hypothetical protein n=1 Tax=Acidicapsa acidisoli TaxID=1615681 RepID=UPI0021E01AAB|nr:hypothetical protein [Acidicapsa acidisoli]
MTTRVNAFAELDGLPDFGVKPKKAAPVPEEKIAQIAEDNNFPSRQPQKPTRLQKRKPRVYRTGRNRQFSAKATDETIDKIYKAADERGVVIGEVLRLAMDALEREGDPR